MSQVAFGIAMITAGVALALATWVLATALKEEVAQ